MTNAYDSKYLANAMANLGEMLDYAVNACGMQMDEFWDLFLATGYAADFGTGSPKVVVGMSGTELAWEVMRKAGIASEFPAPETAYDYSVEYWCGWILAYYQWYTGRTFKNIRRYLSMEEIGKMYPALHEASEDKFVDIVNHRIHVEAAPTRLKSLRMTAGYSQKQLADRAGVTLRSIQHYEQRTKDINKAAGATLLAIAQVIGCRVEDLLEYDSGEIDKQ